MNATLPRDCSLNEFFSSNRHISGYENLVPPRASSDRHLNHGFPGNHAPAGQTGGRFLPFSMITRDLQAGVLSLGGAMIGEGVDDQVIPFLRSKSVCGKLGADLRIGLKPPTALPVLESDFSATWMFELQQVDEQDVNVGAANLSPHRVTVTVNASKLLSLQSSPDFGAMLADQATSRLMAAMDLAALIGTGGAQPIGLFNTTGVQTATFGGAATWAKILSFENLIGNANADGPSLGWVQSPDTRLKWKQTQRDSGTSTFLQDDFGRVAGYPSAMTTELNSSNANDRCVFGNWAKMVFGIFGTGSDSDSEAGVYVLKNPYTLSKQGEDQFTFTMFADVGAVQPQAFVVSTDSAAQ